MFKDTMDELSKCHRSEIYIAEPLYRIVLPWLRKNATLHSGRYSSESNRIYSWDNKPIYPLDDKRVDRAYKQLGFYTMTPVVSNMVNLIFNGQVEEIQENNGGNSPEATSKPKLRFTPC